MAYNGVNSYKFEGVKRLWRHLESNYGDEYFLDLIEDKFGISDQDNNNVESAIKAHIRDS
jgi:hypothetical protein